MIIFTITLWALAGCSLALIIYKTQAWSVAQINPQQLQRSKSLIMGGAFLRWALIVLVMASALSQSFTAVAILLAAFTLTRFALVFYYGGLQRTQSIQHPQIEDYYD